MSKFRRVLYVLLTVFIVLLVTYISFAWRYGA